MHLDNYRIIFIVGGLISILLFSWPAINLLIKPPTGQAFSELYILGPSFTFDNIPFNIRSGETYSIYLNMNNQMGSSSYYTCAVKLGNSTSLLPNATLGLPSPLPPLYQFKSFIGDNGYFQTPLIFSVNNLTFSHGVSHLSGITINGKNYSIDETSVWNPDERGHYYQLIVELWIFNSSLDTLEFHNRSVHLTLNMTG